MPTLDVPAVSVAGLACHDDSQFCCMLNGVLVLPAMLLWPLRRRRDTRPREGTDIMKLARSPSVFLLLAVVACGIGCGEISSTRHEYNADTMDGYVKGKEKTSLFIRAKETHRKDGGDEDTQSGAPYTVRVVSWALTDTGRPLLIRALTLEHEGKKIVVHPPTAEPLKGKLTLRERTDYFNADVEVPLGDQLDFLEGSTVVVEAEIHGPYAEAPEVLKREFKGRKSAFKISRFKALLSY
jgi:hypothetical protein